MTTYTDNYKLELYEGTDPANPADQYNASMRILDGAMTTVSADAAAGVAQVAASLETTKNNLNATNANLNRLTETVQTQGGELTALSATVAAIPSTYATAEALDEVKTEVDKNTPILEEHVNYFAALGVTDDDSADALHTQIDTTYQAAMSNTIAIDALERDYPSAYFSFSPTLATQAISAENAFFFGINKTKNVFKFFGSIVNNTSEQEPVTMQAIPSGSEQTPYYGLPLNYDTGVRPPVRRDFTYVGVYSAPTIQGRHLFYPSFSLGTDGRIYVMSASSQTLTIQPYATIIFMQLQLALAVGDVPSTSNDNVSAYALQEGLEWPASAASDYPE